MRIEITKPETAAELEFRRSENAQMLSERYKLPQDVARRIVEMATSIDQAYAIAELMR